MSESTQQVLKIFAGALLLGILGDELLRALPWGLNVAIWTAAFALIVLTLGGSEEFHFLKLCGSSRSISFGLGPARQMA